MPATSPKFRGLHQKQSIEKSAARDDQLCGCVTKLVYLGETSRNWQLLIFQLLSLE
jgi:hypothetical protein